MMYPGWRHPGRKGQSLVEMALALPMLVVMLIGMVEFAFVLYAHVQVANAAREGARAAAQYRSIMTLCSGLTVKQTAERAIVNRGMDSDGCPNSSGAIAYSALGWLNASPSPSWDVTVTATLDGKGVPAAASTGTVKLNYPYRLIVLSQLFPYLSSPFTITKSVQFEFQP